MNDPFSFGWLPTGREVDPGAGGGGGGGGGNAEEQA